MAGGEDDDSDDKPYEASQKRLEDARRKGNVPRSTDLNAAAAYAGLLLSFAVWGEPVLLHLGAVLTEFFSPRLWRAAMHNPGAGMSALVLGPLSAAFLGVLPLFVLPAALVLGSLFAQQAVTFYGGNLAPQVSRISLLSNFKKRFGRRGLFEFAKSFVKLCLYSGTLIWYVYSREPLIIASTMADPRQSILLFAQLAGGFLGITLAISVGLGAIDYFFQRAEHMRSLRMSHKELMDEVKNSEGDPAMKHRRRQRGVEIARTQMLRDVRNADVVVVNPEHYAVALKWSRAPGSAPTCVAKGVDEMAATIRRLANEHSVPIYREPPTARALYASVDIGQEIAPEYYQPVAAAIRFAEEMRQKQKRRPYGTH